MLRCPHLGATHIDPNPFAAESLTGQYEKIENLTPNGEPGSAYINIIRMSRHLLIDLDVILDRFNWKRPFPGCSSSTIASAPSGPFKVGQDIQFDRLSDRPVRKRE